MLDQPDELPPRPAWFVGAYIAATGALAVLALVVAWLVGGPPRDLVAAGVLAVMAMGSWVLRVHVLTRVSLAAGSIIALASSVLVGPFGGAVINALAVALERGPRPLRARVFNTAMNAILGAVAGLTYLWAGGAADLTHVTGVAEIMARVGGPFMLANLVQTVTNVLLLGGIVWADRGDNYRQFVGSMLTSTGLAQVGFGVIGFLFVILWVPAGVGPFSAVLILMPLFVARWAFVQYSEERAAHDRTLAAFVAAVGARDPYAVGHSERVAVLAEWISEQLGLASAQSTALRYAAMLHDIGWIGAPAHPAADGRHGFADVDTLMGHPDRGADLLREISFLHDSLPGIRHHHERFDGEGYPVGLAGVAIPQSARIIAVADAFDTLTSTGPGRPCLSCPQALDELWARAGSQVDPTIVSALERALERHPWTGASVEMTGTAFDHDDPATSDLVSGTVARTGTRRS